MYILSKLGPHRSYTYGHFIFNFINHYLYETRNLRNLNWRIKCVVISLKHLNILSSVKYIYDESLENIFKNEIWEYAKSAGVFLLDF